MENKSWSLENWFVFVGFVTKLYLNGIIPSSFVSWILQDLYLNGMNYSDLNGWMVEWLLKSQQCVFTSKDSKDSSPHKLGVFVMWTRIDYLVTSAKWLHVVTSLEWWEFVLKGILNWSYFQVGDFQFSLKWKLRWLGRFFFGRWLGRIFLATPPSFCTAHVHVSLLRYGYLVVSFSYAPSSSQMVRPVSPVGLSMEQVPDLWLRFLYIHHFFGIFAYFCICDIYMYIYIYLFIYYLFIYLFIYLYIYIYIHVQLHVLVSADLYVYTCKHVMITLATTMAILDQTRACHFGGTIPSNSHLGRNMRFLRPSWMLDDSRYFEYVVHVVGCWQNLFYPP